MKRRAFLALPLLLAARQALTTEGYPRVEPGRALRFPRDHGSHPDFRTEWWYLTGWVADDSGNGRGVQVTFFRNRPRIAEANPSAFAPRQLVFAHAALADPRRGRLQHDQRAARAGFALAGVDEETLRVWIDDWSLALAGDAYLATIAAREFTLRLRFTPTQPVLLQGEAGYSRKGHDPVQASWYYSRPQLAVTGTVRDAGGEAAVTGHAWLDHEWSSEAMAADAVGWDWTGINLADGGAVMAFRMRDRSGGALWAGGTLSCGGRQRAHLYAGRGALRPEALVAFAAYGCDLSRGDGGEAWRPGIPARADHRRPGTRCQCLHRHDLLGRRGARNAVRPRGGPRLPGADRLWQAADAVTNSASSRGTINLMHLR